MKFRLMFVILTFAALFTYVPISAQSNDYPDLKGHWAENIIRDWIGKKWVTGYDDGTFKPDAGITRGELITIINHALGFEASGDSPTFTDISYRDWFFDEVWKATSAQYVSGYDDHTFRPFSLVSRQEFAVMIDRIVGMPSQTRRRIYLIDMADISSWAVSSVESVLDNKLMSGYDDATFQPKRPITRAETIAVLNQLLTHRVTGTMEDVNGKEITFATVYIQSINSELGKNMQVRNGRFWSILPFGNYKISYVYSYDVKKEDYLGYVFSLEQDKDPHEITVKLKQPNVFGRLLDAQGNPIANVSLAADYQYKLPYGTGGGMIEFQTDNQGYFEKHLSSNEYRFRYYRYKVDNRDIFVPIHHSIIVNDQDEVVSSLMTANGLRIQLNTSNVRGSVSREESDGIINVVFGSITIQTSDPQRNDYIISVANGRFDLYLPEGDYEIHGLSIAGSSDYYPMEYKFSVNSEIGKDNPLELKLVSEGKPIPTASDKP